MAKCLVSLTEETVAMLMASKVSNDESMDSVVRRIMAGPAPKPPPAIRPEQIDALSGHQVRVFAETVYVPKVHDCLATVLEALARRDCGFLARLATEQSRSRRIVARAPEALYPASPHLAKHARELPGGWWAITNCSRPDVERSVATACRVAGVALGVDVAIRFLPKTLAAN